MKKVVSLILALVMCLSLSVTAFAAGPQTTITLNISDNPFTYNLIVPATINFNENATDYADLMDLVIPVKITGMNNLVAISGSSSYKIQNLGIDYEVKVTGNATKLTSGANTLGASGICGPYDADIFGTKGTVKLSKFDSEGTASSNELDYFVSKAAIAAAAPGNYTATVTFTATVEPVID